MNERSKRALATSRERLGDACQALADAVHGLVYALREMPKAEPPKDIVIDTRAYEDQVRDAYACLPAEFWAGPAGPSYFRRNTERAETNAERNARLLRERKEGLDARKAMYQPLMTLSEVDRRRRSLYTGPAPDLEVAPWPPAIDGYHNPDLPR